MPDAGAYLYCFFYEIKKELRHLWKKNSLTISDLKLQPSVKILQY